MDGAELDVAKTPAFAVLDELFKSGKVTETKCVPAPVSRRIRRSEPVAVDACRLQDYKSKYLDLHEAVLKTYQNEKELLGRGRQLKQVRPPLARQRALASHPLRRRNCSRRSRSSRRRPGLRASWSRRKRWKRSSRR